MAFKEGTEVEHVHAFRALRSKAAALDEAIDSNQLTPHEAFAELDKAMSEFPPQAKAAKKEKAGA